jgi:lipopolysaccharide transport protein LptA
MPVGRIFGFAVCISLSAALLSFADEGGLERGDAEVKSDRLEVEHTAGKARFWGNVRAKYANLAISCDEMTVSYDESGGIISLKAVGRVVVARDDATARADSARLDARQGLLVLEGKPTLIKGPNRIDGARIEIHLASGRLDVIQAKGKFKIGGEGGR